MSIIGDPQYAEVTITTDSNGYFTYSFTNDIDAAMATPNSNQGSFIGANVQVTGAKSVKVRCWGSASGWTVQPMASQQVTVTLLGLSPA
jgi:hypothetical protein